MALSVSEGPPAKIGHQAEAGRSLVRAHADRQRRLPTALFDHRKAGRLGAQHPFESRG